MTFIATKKLEATIREALVEWFKSYGFCKAASPCAVKRWQGNIYLEISCTVIKMGGNNYCEPMGVLGFRESRAVRAAFLYEYPEKAFDRAVDLQVSYCQMRNNWRARFVCDQKEEVPILLDALNRYYVEELMPVLSLFSDPQVLAQAYLDNIEKRHPSFDVAVINNWRTASAAVTLVRCYLPEHYAAMKQRLYPEFFSPLIPMYKEPLDRMIALLDQQSMSPAELVASAEKILEERIALLKS